MREQKNKIVCLVGESGCGKSTLYDLLRAAGHEVVDSYTTRAPRKPNELGHTFVTKEEFDAIRGDLAAYTEFDGHEYGTTFEQLRNSKFYIIDPSGVDYFAGKIGRENIVVIYICCSIVARRVRLEQERGEEHAWQRIHHDKEKFKDFIDNKKWDFIILNEVQDQLLPNMQKIERIYKESNSLEV